MPLVSRGGCLRTFCPLFTQDLFFKYTWNNFLHFQVELCIAAILSHAAGEERAEAGGSESKVEPPQGSGNGNRSLETPQPVASLPENTMVTHVSSEQCPAHCCRRSSAWTKTLWDVGLPPAASTPWAPVLSLTLIGTRYCLTREDTD